MQVYNTISIIVCNVVVNKQINGVHLFVCLNLCFCWSFIDKWSLGEQQMLWETRVLEKVVQHIFYSSLTLSLVLKVTEILPIWSVCFPGKWTCMKNSPPLAFNCHVYLSDGWTWLFRCNKGWKFLKKLWCCVGGGNKVIWLYQLIWKCKLATVTCYKSWRFEH